MSDLEQPVAPAEPPAPPAAPEESGAKEVDGVKMVPITALHEEREKAKALKAKAAEYDNVAQWVRANQQAVAYVAAHPDVMQNAGRANATAPAEAAPELVDLATSLDLYTRDGQPDTARAAKVQEKIRSEATASARAAIAPHVQQSESQQSATNLQRAMAIRTPDGRMPNPETLQKVWAATPANVTANENAASMLAYTIMGMDAVMAAPSQQPSAPLVTEAPGGRFPSQPGRSGPSALETKVAEIRGFDMKKYAEMTKNFQPGRANQLED